jgi:hypothetical protein
VSNRSFRFWRRFRFGSDYNRQKIAGKFNLLLFLLMALIVVNSAIVLFFTWSMRNENLSALASFETVDQVEISQRVFASRISVRMRCYTLFANRAQTIPAGYRQNF